MKLTIITVIIMSLTMSYAVQARDSDRHGARKSAKPNATKSQKPRQIRRDDRPRTATRQAQQRPAQRLKTAPPMRNKAYQTPSRPKIVNKPGGFGSPKQTISNNKRLQQNNVYRGNNSRSERAKNEQNRQVFTPNNRPEDRANRRSGTRDNQAIESRSRPNNRISSERRITTREVPDYKGNRNANRPNSRGNSSQRISSNSRLPESMPIRRYNDSRKDQVNRHNNGRRVADYRPTKRDNFRYQQHRWLVNKQKHRRHSISMPRQLDRYRNNHFRGKHYYGNWHRGHNHYHYDYRYRYLYNPYQWYDDYYYHSYFSWRWNHPQHSHLSGYYDHYMDPYYCPDDFGRFVTTLAVGALILSW